MTLAPAWRSELGSMGSVPFWDDLSPVGTLGWFMKLAATRFLYSYWNELRGERSTPDRADLDPARIRTMLCDIFMLEADAASTFPLRLAGARMSSLFLRELKGESFVDLWAPEDRPDLTATIGGVLDDPTPAILGVSTAPVGRMPLELELLLLPLRHFGRTRARVMGCLCPAGHPGWYGLLPVAGLKMTTLRILGPQAPAGPTRGAPAFDSAASFDEIPLRRQRLSIYSGGLIASPPRPE